MNEKSIVYERACNRSLDKYMGDVSLTWMKRLKVCVNVESGLHFLHTGCVMRGIATCAMFPGMGTQTA